MPLNSQSNAQTDGRKHASLTTHTALGSVFDNLPIMFCRHRRHSPPRPREANGVWGRLTRIFDVVLPLLLQVNKSAVSVRCMGTM